MTAKAISHPTEEALKAYGLGRLDDASAESVCQHLEQCPDCRTRVAEASADSFLVQVRDAQGAGKPLLGQSLPGGLHGKPGVGPPEPPAASSLPPGLVDHPDYQILRELGRGGMGVVYLAQNKLMGRKEVLKVVGGHLLGRTGVAERFLREIRSAASLHHTNIVTAFSVLRAGESLIFAMEFVDGYDLAQLVKGKGPLPVAHACNFIHQAALGLQYAYEKGMVHRDIKPSNLILTRNGKKPVVKVLDFGLAKVTSEGQGQGDSGLTREGQMLGTPDFISPEQIRDAQSADIRADVYSLGCTLYYLLAGRPPFRCENLWDLYQAHFSMDASPLNLIRPEVPSELAALITKMMAKDPSRRFQTPAEVALALAPFFRKGAATFRSPQPALPTEPPGDPGQPSRPDPDARAAVPDHPALPKATEATRWESLIDFRTDETPVDPKPAPPSFPSPSSTRRPPWSRRTVAVAAGALSLLVLLGIVITIRISGEKGEISIKWDRPATAQPSGSSPSGDSIRRPEPKPSKREEPSVASKPVALPTITNSVEMRLVLLPPGEFLMGSPDEAIEADEYEKPLHKIRIRRSFYLGESEVTQSQYKAVMGQNPSHFSAGGAGKGRVAGQSPDRHPVEQVTWFDAIRFCNRLSEKEGKKPFYEIDGEHVGVPDWDSDANRLPTEGEWEYACRAGSSSPTRFHFGDNAAGLRSYAWFKGNSEQQSHPVGQKVPNDFGLYDMHGNVWEWCWDWFGPEYYRSTTADNPAGPPSGERRVTRGGGWPFEYRLCRSAIRGNSPPQYRAWDLGFRIARNNSRSTQQPAATSAQGADGPTSVPAPAPVTEVSPPVNRLALKDIPVHAGEKVRIAPPVVALRQGPPPNGSPGAFNLVAPFRTKSPVLDGTIGPDEYGPPLALDFTDDKNPGMSVIYLSDPPKDAMDLSAELSLACTRNALFVAVKVLDDQMIDRPANVSPSFCDGVELFLDGDRLGGDLPPGSREGFQIASTAEGRKYATGVGTTDRDFKVKTSRFAGGYVVEFEIPHGTIDTQDGAGVTPSGPGSILRFNMGIEDNDKPIDVEQRYCVLWGGSRTSSPFRDGDGTWPVDLYMARPARYELVSGPKGAAVDPETGVFTWVGPMEARTETVTIRARDVEKPEVATEGIFTITTTPPAAVKPAVVATDKLALSKPRRTGKRPTTRRAEDDGPGMPFQVPTNGLEGTRFVVPITFGPDFLGFNPPGTAEPWFADDAFARVRTIATLGYPRLPISRYVFEVEVTVHKDGQIMFMLGDPHHQSVLNLGNVEAGTPMECLLQENSYNDWGWKGSEVFVPERRLKLKVVVGDGRQSLFLDEKRIVPDTAQFIMPTDCCLRIRSQTADSATIHRCSLRPLTDADVTACGWSTPTTTVRVKEGEAAARLAGLTQGLPVKPKAGDPFVVKTTGTPMAWIAPGEFLMGTGNRRDPQFERSHRVRLTSGYWMARTEVTQGEFRVVTGINPSRITGSPHLPVDWVSWEQAMAYCQKLSLLELRAGRVPSGYEYRLPTEAEWEYAARAGSDADSSMPATSVWSRDNSGLRPHEVAESPPNAWGLYDMQGNALEWCLSAWFDYPKGATDVTINPLKLGNPEKDRFVARGGAWWSVPHRCSNIWRFSLCHDANAFIGFRIVLARIINRPGE